jgi:hypothetical protein
MTVCQTLWCFWCHLYVFRSVIGLVHFSHGSNRVLHRVGLQSTIRRPRTRPFSFLRLESLDPAEMQILCVANYPEPCLDGRQTSAPKLGPLPRLPPLQVNFWDGAPLTRWLQILASNMGPDCELDWTPQPSAHRVVTQHDDKWVVACNHDHQGFPA